ncbi:MAG: hypothetical protein RLZZ352_2842 [Pseudomonadota bacterium]|jgi:putative two-component system response regulator
MHTPEAALPPSDIRTALAVTVFAVTSLSKTRNADSCKHVLRVQRYVQALGHQLQAHPRFSASLTDAFLAQLFQAVPLYDMGTIGIPDRILLKPSRLTQEEFEIMKTHTTLAVQALENAERVVGASHPFIQTVKELAHSHQEKWDGSGYPQGLSGEQIPVSARLMAVADVYDALTSDRVYKAGIAHEAAMGVIFQGRGSHFDPDMVDAFMDIQHEFAAIAQRHPDTEQDMHRKMDYLVHAIAETAEL